MVTRTTSPALQVQAAARADPGRGPGRDDVARLERDHLAGRRDQLGDRADHVGGGLVLLQFVVHPQPQPQILRVGHLEGRGDARPQRQRAVHGLGGEPVVGERLRGDRLPPVAPAGGHVVGHAVAGHVGQRVRRGDVPAADADDHGQLRLPVVAGLVRGADDDRVVRADDGRGRGLEEEVRPPALGGDLAAHLLHVAAVVDARADHLAGPAQRRQQRVVLDRRRAVGVHAAQHALGLAPVLEQLQHGGPALELGGRREGPVVAEDGHAIGSVAEVGNQGPGHEGSS